MPSILLAALLLAPLALGPGDPPAAPGAAAQAEDVTAPRTLTGHVRWTDGKPPRRRKLRMDSDPVCVELCRGETMYDERAVVDEEGNVANVVVYISGGLPEKEWKAAEDTVLIDQIGCRYVPHVVAFQLGQPVKIRNSDPTTHNVHLVSRYNGSWSVTQARKGTIDPKEPFTKPEFEKPTALLKCDIHPWMEARLFIFDHPFFAVSDEDGNFSLDLGDLPAGEYEVTALHEKYRSAKIKVEIPAEEGARVRFHFNKAKENGGEQVKAKK